MGNIDKLMGKTAKFKSSSLPIYLYIYIYDIYIKLYLCDIYIWYLYKFKNCTSV